MDNREWKVESTPDNKNLKSVVNDIDSALKGEGGIRLDPEYQRDYKFTQIDESLLIESLLMNIPIPVIYLSSDTRQIPYTANVIDGQHRLRAVYRFLKNKFALKGLEIYKELNDKKFQELVPELQNKLLYQSRLSFENIHVQDNPDLEIEIFKRYNKGTHPLSKQELRHTIYICKFNTWLNEKVKEFFNDDTLKKFYNISKKRYADKSAHESICIMVAILYFGLDKACSTSLDYADKFLEYAAKFPKQDELIEECGKLLNTMNEFLIKVNKRYGVLYPFSKEIYGVESRNYKLQTPILMLISSFIKYMIDKKIDIVNDDNFEGIYMSIADTLANSYLEEDFKGSNTRASILLETLKHMINSYEKNIYVSVRKE